MLDKRIVIRHVYIKFFKKMFDNFKLIGYERKYKSAKSPICNGTKYNK